MYDFIILGQGITGSNLAYNLLKHQKKICVIDNKNPNSSSKIAAGLYNPITLKKLGLVWKADIFIPYLLNFYKEVEETTNTIFFNSLPFYKILNENEEINTWKIKSLNSNYFDKIIKEKHNFLKYNFFRGKIKNTGYLDTKKYIQKIKSWIKTQKNITIIGENISENQIDIKENKIEISTKTNGLIKGKYLLFANGHETSKFSLFNWVPFYSVKGEILTIEIKNCDLDFLISKDIFILPIGNYKYKVGSTYSREKLNYISTEKAKEQLIKKLEQITNLKYTVVQQKAAIRPTINDRKPVLGKHPKWNHVYIINGMGSKGISQSPYLTQQLIEHILFNKEIWEEIDIKRFYKKYNT